MDSGLEQFITERRAEGYEYVVISVDAGCIGWGHTLDQAWFMAVYFAYNRHQRQSIQDAQCFHADPLGPMIENWHQYQERIKSQS